MIVVVVVVVVVVVIIILIIIVATAVVGFWSVEACSTRILTTHKGYALEPESMKLQPTRLRVEAAALAQSRLNRAVVSLALFQACCCTLN